MVGHETIDAEVERRGEHLLRAVGAADTGEHQDAPVRSQLQGTQQFESGKKCACHGCAQPKGWNQAAFV